MTGADNYREAQRHLELAAGHCDRGEALAMQYELGCVQARALLALAAAVVTGTVMRPEDRDEWDHATGMAAKYLEAEQ
jgi:hypothetical protein